MARPGFSEAADVTPTVCGQCGVLVGDEDLHARAHESVAVPTDPAEVVEHTPQPPHAPGRPPEPPAAPHRGKPDRG